MTASIVKLSTQRHHRVEVDMIPRGEFPTAQEALDYITTHFPKAKIFWCVLAQNHDTAWCWQAKMQKGKFAPLT